MTRENVKFPIVDAQGSKHEVEVGLHTYKQAAAKGVNLTQLMADTIPTNPRAAGADPTDITQMSPMEQMIQHVGIRLKGDVRTGSRASTVDELLATDPLTTTDQGQIPGIARRLLAPEILLQIANINLVDNPDILMQAWEDAIGSTQSVNSKQVGQALMNEVTNTSDGLVRPGLKGQLSLPETMITYTLGERQWVIPTTQVGLMFSNDVLKYETLDRVGLTLAQNIRAFTLARFYEDISNVINGDAPANMAAVPFQNASVFDPAGNISGTKKLTHRAWVKWLMKDSYKYTITHVLGSEDAWLDYQERAGLPTVMTDVSSDSNRLPAPASLVGMAIPTPKFLAMPTNIIGADRLIGFDASRGLRRFRNVSADYTAVENLVLRGGVGMTFETGVLLTKDNPGVFRGLTLGA